MPVPKKKTSYTKTRLRRSHQALAKTSYISCPNCGDPKLPHRVCRSCGFYRGKRIFQQED